MSSHVVLSCEKDRPIQPLDDSYTVDFALAAELLGYTQEQVRKLAKVSQLHAQQGVFWPLKVISNGHGLTLQSVLAYRRETRLKALPAA